MREWCGCGASIRARRSDVLTWRTAHRHTGDEPSGATSDTETSGQPIGFVPEMA